MKAYAGLGLLVIAFAVFSVAVPLYLIQTNIRSDAWLTKAKEKVLAAKSQGGSQGFPATLRIPSINVEASVEYVGVTPEGRMGVPQSASNVGWFGLGPRPGDLGSAVMDGHFDDANGRPAVFTDLYKLKAGDKIFVESYKGDTTTFVVQRTQAYDPGFANDVFGQSTGTHLNLITCDGIWDGVKKSYSKRLVVFSDIST